MHAIARSYRIAQKKTFFSSAKINNVPSLVFNVASEAQLTQLTTYT